MLMPPKHLVKHGEAETALVYLEYHQIPIRLRDSRGLSGEIHDS
jgi:hypothetical protein